MPPEDSEGESSCSASGAGVVGPTMGIRSAPMLDSENDFQASQRQPDSVCSRSGVLSAAEQLKTVGISLLTRDIQGVNLPEEAVQIYLESWRPKTREAYLVYIKKWIQFCVERGLDYRCPELSGVFLFLFQLFQKGYSYSSINVARSALSSSCHLFEGQTVGSVQTLSRFVRGMQKLRPQVSRYASTWDVDMVLEYICSLWPLRALTFEWLSKRMVMLFLLATSQRVQTLLTLKVTDIFWADNEQTVVFRLSELLKHHRRGSLGVLTLKAFVQKPKLCVVRCLKEYLQRSESLRGNDDPRLFVISRRPFRPVSHDTLARWVLDCMREAGVLPNPGRV